ncbi:MAG TPA: discoidin domain-containing protein [Candidatus Eremiobacteraeota bacterium]|nr:MAG: hypothetical protein BWY64_03190 [bacterium ADurb.Bin363]HPZ06633.1 discoidin domain-containing protein [Candidatus Eremiobacteraeota bacterium]
MRIYKFALFLFFIIFLLSGLCTAEELISKEGLYSFNLPEGWKSEAANERLIASPLQDTGYKVRISYIDFSSPEEKDLNKIPRLFSGSFNFILTETGDLTETVLKTVGAEKGFFFKGKFLSPEGMIEVEEIYLLNDLKGYGIYTIIPVIQRETIKPQVEEIISSFKLLSLSQVIASTPGATETPVPLNNSKEVEIITPEDGVNVAFKGIGAYVEGARDDLGNISAMLDGDATTYSQYNGYTYALINEPIIVVLDKVYLLNKIDILFWDLMRSYYQYNIETSVDKQNWELLVDRSYGEWYSWQYISFQPRAIKYIRINCSYNSDYSGNYKIVELTAYLIKQ